MAATLQQLADAESAYHKLLTGRQVVSVTIDGIQTQYTQSDRNSLKMYIEDLRSELNTGTSRRKPPMGIM